MSHDRYRSHEEYFQAYDLKDRHAIASSPFDLTEPSLTRTVTQAALSVDYYLRGWKLSSVSAYQDRRLERVLTTGNADPENQKTFSQELRVATSGDIKRPVDGVFGLYYEKQAFERDRGIAVPGVSAFLFPGPSRSESNLRSMAAFGEGVWHATERLDLTAGLRYGIDSADIHYNRTGAAALSFAGDKTFRSLTPKVSVGYQAAPGWRVYGLYSEGYKAGASTASPTTAPAAFRTAPSGCATSRSASRPIYSASGCGWTARCSTAAPAICRRRSSRACSRC